MAKASWQQRDSGLKVSPALGTGKRACRAAPGLSALVDWWSDVDGCPYGLSEVPECLETSECGDPPVSDQGGAGDPSRGSCTSTRSGCPIRWGVACVPGS